MAVLKIPACGVTMALSNDYRINALLQGIESRWNHSLPLGTATVVPYAFMDKLPAHYQQPGMEIQTFFTAQEYATFAALDEDRRSLVRSEFAEVAKRIPGLAFIEVSSADAAVIMVGSFTYDATARGDANGYDPAHSNPLIAGDIWFNNSSKKYDLNQVWTDANGVKYPIGRLQFADMALHELGHALGLKHPGNYDQYGGGGVGSNIPPYLPAAEDVSENTVMSYYGDLASSELRPYDLLALGFLYGTAPPANKQWLLATSGNKVIQGSALNEKVLHMPGSQGIDTGGGIDVVQYNGIHAAYVVTLASEGLIVRDAAGSDGTDTLTNVERIQFADTMVAFDLAKGQAAYNTVVMIGTAFGAGAISQYFKTGLPLFDSGFTLPAVSNMIVNNKYIEGLVGDSNLAWVQHVYKNVTGMDAPAGTANYYSGLLDSGVQTKAALLALAAGLPQIESQIGLIGLQTTGVEYVG